ncbi:MAG: hypothetical protein KatS3mg108_2726 [Isosphaeraceae bacterium]|jgi:glucose/arabinose dehydrogenase|nr:MAG: hypothetical protein KatS3mg108_2726 [Isosphaeraceae bacterium]
MPLRSLTAVASSLLALVVLAAPATAQPDEPRLELRKGDRIVLIGNTLAERMQYFGHFETLLQSRFPDFNLTVRNLGWSADELTLRPRSNGFQNHGHNLTEHKPSVVLAFLGFNESFAGSEGLARFQSDLARFVDETTSTAYDGEATPRLVLVSPIAHEDLGDPHLPDGSANNANLALYTQTMAEVARQKGVVFVDLFTPTRSLYAETHTPLTINGVHLNEAGDAAVARLIDEALFGPRPASVPADLDALRAAVLEKDRQFFFDYRAVNGCYIYGERKEPFGVVNFPAEFAKLRQMIANRDQRIWAIARGETVPPQIDDSNTGPFATVVSNVARPAPILAPDEALQSFTLPDGYVIELFASEQQFPDLRKPVQMTFDARGRLWVATMPSYPMYLPGTPPNDKILILEDSNGDGRADSCTTFADGLHLPTGLEFGKGGLFVGQQPNLMWLKDVDGDDRADLRELVLHGFDSADSHHAIHTFLYDPAGGLHFQEGVFHHTQVETPYGPQRVKNAGIFRFEPRTWRFEVWTSYPFANPWGHAIDRWGQNFIADASGGANYFGTAFSGQVDYPDKHSSMEQFFPMQWRPTCGCELVSSRAFPDDTQGDYLLNNNIGFQGILRYRVREADSGFRGQAVEPLLRSSDPCFRPVDLEFGPDGALYVVDWYNPLVGHMQHSLRDSNRDTRHGRIYRIRHKDKPLLQPARIAGASIPELLELLRSYEDRTRYRVRMALWEQPEADVLKALDTWIDSLDPADPDLWRLRLEGLWLHAAFDHVQPSLLRTLLRCPEPKARAAATRVLGAWRDRLPDTLDLLRTQINDEHPRVRLEAVRALSFFHGERAAQAQEIALELLQHPLDYYLEYTLNETNKTLERRLKNLDAVAR